VDLYAADGSPNSLPRLRLRSMYAEKPEDCLLFQVHCRVVCDAPVYPYCASQVCSCHHAHSPGMVRRIRGSMMS
jgi:hypothetical protein